MESCRGWVRFRPTVDFGSSLIQPLLVKTKTKSWILPSGASVRSLMKQYPDILFQQFQSHEKELQVVWTTPVSLSGILKTQFAVQQVGIQDKEVVNTVWLIKGVLQDHLAPRRLQKFSVLFVSENTGKWRFIELKNYKIEPKEIFLGSFNRPVSQNPSPKSKTRSRKIKTPKAKKKLLKKKPDKHPPHIPSRLRRKQAELDFQIDQMISKENFTGFKHITYSSRQKYSQQTVKIDPLDLSFAKRIVYHKHRIQKRTEKQKEEMGEMLAIMKELTQNKETTDRQILNQTVKFLLTNPEKDTGFTKQDSFIKRAIDSKKRTLPTPTAQDVIDSAAKKLDKMVYRTRSVMK